MSGARVWSDAVVAARLFAVDPIGTGGVLLRSRAGPVRDRFMMVLRAALPSAAPLRHVPLQITDGRLLGGLDLSATLSAGRPIAERGLLAEADGGVLTLAMAERLAAATTAHVVGAIDARETLVERDGLSLRMPARFGVVALDEGLDDEYAPAALRDRLAFHVDLNALAFGDTDDAPANPAETMAARVRLARLRLDDAQRDALCRAAAALGIASLRAPLLAGAVARASAALAGSDIVAQDDVALAAQLVLAPRATVLPQTEPDPAESLPEPDPPPPSDGDDQREQGEPDLDRALDDIVLAAAQAAIPPDMLAALHAAAGRARSSGKAGALQKSVRRGRPVGVRRGDIRSGAKLNVIETLRAAAPWQPLRRRQAAADGPAVTQARVLIRKDDVRLTRFRERSETVTIFAVDASGSAALHRLAEAKGAVELLLADCYVRRDQVALISFRGSIAELLLPPTRSLARAKRCLAGLPGGGGTPLAAGIDAAFALADSTRRKGQSPTVILLTDGRANIARDGAQGRARAEEDALGAARRLRASAVDVVLVDTSPRPGPLARQLAEEMAARYLPLPHADAVMLSQAVRATVQDGVRRA